MTASVGKKICIVGSGNWGSVVAKIVGENVSKYPDTFHPGIVKMLVFEEIVDGQKLTDIINAKHQNIRYLKSHKLPESIVADPYTIKAPSDADVLIFVLPNNFIKRHLKL